MTWQLAAQDVVLYVFLVAGVSLYGNILRQKANSQLNQATEKQQKTVSRRITLKFQQYSILMVSGWMVIGVLYQCGVMSPLFAATLFSVSTVVSVPGLVRLRQYINQMHPQ